MAQAVSRQAKVSIPGQSFEVDKTALGPTDSVEGPE